MTAPLTTAAGVRDAAVACATAVARALPLEGGLTVDTPLTGTLLPEEQLLPGDAPRAVVAALGGALGGSVVLLLSGELAQLLETELVGRQELTAVLQPLLGDVRDTLEQLAGDAVQLTAIQEVDARVALAGRDESLFAAVGLTADGAQQATLGLLLGTGERTPAAAAQPARPMPGRAADRQPAAPRPRSLEILHDVQMGVTAELGRTRMAVRDLLNLAPGAMIELDRAAGSPVDVLVNGTLIGRGDVVIVDEQFGIRITEILGVPGQPARG